MTGGEWTTKGRQREAREAEREALRLEKRHLRDLRWAVERSTIEASDWADLLSLQQAHGKEDPCNSGVSLCRTGGTASA